MSALFAERDLLENHLMFLATHRGALLGFGDSVLIQSDRDEFTFAFVGPEANMGGLATFNSFQLLPGAPEPEGFTHHGGLSYLVYEGDVNSLPNGPDILRSQSLADFEVFSWVQARGFNPDDEKYAVWHPWLRQANMHNLGNPDQYFYVASLGEPVGTALLLVHEGIGGIYAVATLEAFRKKGIGTALLKRAILDARERGCHTITLQVAQGSYAETFYQKLGFGTVFSTRFFVR
jgi:GNAT superfamily N-acetyltransferase